MSLITDYLDFEIEIRKNQDNEDGRQYRVRVQRSPYGGTPYGYFDKPFTEKELQEFRQKITPRTVSEAKPLREFGQRLFNAVFVSEVKDCFNNSLNQVEHEDKGLRICLRLDKVPELASYPWEYLHHGENFLTLDKILSVVRYLDLPKRPKVYPIKSSLNVLIVTANPKDQSSIKTETEWESIKDALSHLTKTKVVSLSRLRSATRAKLSKELETRDYHVLHFIGHGVFEKSSKEGYLCFEGSDHHSDLVSADDLGNFLHRYNSLRLCILNCCESGYNEYSGSDEFVGVAQRLTAIGIPAVIAMQFRITDKAALIFTQRFYEVLAKKYNIDAALVEARHLIRNEVDSKLSTFHEWGTPVLYTRVQDGTLFVGPPNRERRNFLLAGTTGVAAGIFGLTTGWLANDFSSPPIIISKPSVEWTMSNCFSSALPEELILSQAPDKIAKSVRLSTDGDFIITVEERESPPDANTILDNVNDDNKDVDCGYNGVYYNSEKYRPLLFNCAIPFGLTPQEQNMWLFYKKEGQEIPYIWEIYQNILNLNVISFPAGSTGSQMGGWFKKEINTIDDFKNINMRIPGLGREVLSKLGITSQNGIPITELSNKLKEGRIEGVEWTGPYDDLILDLDQGAKDGETLYYYSPGWWEPSTTFEMQVNKKQWDKLSDSYREIFKLACIKTHMETLAEYNRMNSKTWWDIKENGFPNSKTTPVEHRVFNDDILGEAKNVTESILNGYEKGSDNFKEVYTEWKIFKNRVRMWSELNNLSDFYI